ncbi:hypothetical protein G5714_005997 [Onychostoma macrolepis]|uniref:Uncharacterized protein n=1 Tax=Onychostoma macrolepis TaxID=369639 RepID=A0A7J6D2Q9_9TELE|nr:hypothetical protein G5714_005997 [Onychostoma macrolepis]
MRCPRQLRQNLLLHLLNSSWLQFARSARDQLNRRINTITRRLPGPGPRRGGAGRVRLRTLRGPAGPRAPDPPRYDSRPIRGEAHCRQRAAGGPPLSWWRERRLAAPPNPTVAPFPSILPRGLLPPPSNIGEFVSFGQEEGDDTMSISASEREDWAGSEPDQTDSSGSPDLQEELMRVLSRAVQELELTWSPPEEPARSKLDSWSSSPPGFSQRRDNPRPATAAVTATAPRQEPDVRRKAWGPGRKRQGQRRSPRRDSRPPPVAKPSS